MTDHHLPDPSADENHVQSPGREKQEGEYAANAQTPPNSVRRPLPTAQHPDSDQGDIESTTADPVIVPRPSYPRWHDALAGALAGAGSRLVTAPLDLIRIRRQLTRETSPLSAGNYYFQLLKHIVQTEQGGVLALFRGNLAAMYMWVAYAAVQFSVYTETSHYLQSRHWNLPLSASPSPYQTFTLPSSLIAFVAGGAAGVCATLSTYPLDLCRTTFAARGPVRSNPLAATASTGGSAPPTTIWAFATHLYQTKGVKGFYAGSGPAVIQIIPYMGLNFLIYEMAVRRLRERQQQQQQEMQVDDGRRQHPPVAHSGLAGAVSGAVSKFLVYPMDTIKKRLQIQSFYTHPWDHSSSTSVSSTSRNLPHYHYTSMWDCARNMYQTEGLTSFYRGVIPSLVKSAMAASLTFAIFSSTKQLLQSLDDERRLRDSARKQ